MRTFVTRRAPGDFGWTDSHLHALVQGRLRSEVFYPGYEKRRGAGKVTDEMDVMQGELLREKCDTLDFQYDVGDF